MLSADNELKTLFAKVKTIAVLGANDRPGRPVDMVGRYLIDAGFTVFPVHPKRKEVWGLEARPGVLDLDDAPQAMVLFRAAQFCPDHARECLTLAKPPLVFWMQSGIYNSEVNGLLGKTPTMVVQDRCIMVEHRRLAG